MSRELNGDFDRNDIVSLCVKKLKKSIIATIAKYFASKM